MTSSTVFSKRCQRVTRLAPERKHQLTDHRIGTIPAIVTKLKLPKILCKMLRADMNMGAINPAFQLRPKALNAVHGRASGRDILFATVVDRLVPVAVNCAQSAISNQFVSMDLAIGLNMLGDDRHQRSAASIGNHTSDNLAAALHHAENNGLAFAALPTIHNAANKRLINFDRAERTTKRTVSINFRHILADFVAHAPSRFVGHAKLALDFLRGHAVARGAEKKHHIEPVAQTSARPVKRSVGSRIDLRAAILTRIAAPSLHAVEVGIAATLLAIVTVAVARTHKVIEAAFLGREAVLKLAKGRCFAHA